MKSLPFERFTSYTSLFSLLTGDQHEYCKSDNSDAIQAAENSSARKNTFQTQQDSDNNKVANRKDSNHPTGYSENPSTSINQQVSKQINSAGNSPGEANKQQQHQASSPSPDTTISVGSSASTAIRAESNFEANFQTADNTSKRSPVTVEKPITTAFSAVTAPLTSTKLENNNNNRNISDL